MKFPLLLCIAILAGGCNVSNSIAQTGIDKIEFGTAGGFTGATIAYTLGKEGQLSKNEKNGAVALKKLQGTQLRNIFTQASELKSYSYNVPDNVYSFVRISTREGENYIVWSLGSDKVDKRVVALHNELMALTK